VLDKVIDDFMDSPEKKRAKYSPKKTMKFGNKLIDELNGHTGSPQKKGKANPAFLKLI
jgi:hypothetical protein